MVKTVQLRSLVHTQEPSCWVCPWPAPPTICGLNFTLTRRQQRRGSGSYTTVSHISFPWGRRVLKLFQMSEFSLTSGARHFMKQNLKEDFNWPSPCFTVSFTVRVSIKHSMVFLCQSCRKISFFSPLFLFSLSLYVNPFSIFSCALYYCN